jgi:CRP-like cAMP-binding protein
MMPTDPDYLQNFSCFCDLSEDQRKAVAQLANAVCFAPGYVLSGEDKPGDYLYLLASGEVEVMYNIGEEGLTRVDLVSGEEVIGCSALVPPFTYTSTTRCLMEIEVLKLDAKALRKLMQEDCSLGFSIQQRIMMFLMDRIVDFRLGI